MEFLFPEESKFLPLGHSGVARVHIPSDYTEKRAGTLVRFSTDDSIRADHDGQYSSCYNLQFE